MCCWCTTSMVCFNHFTRLKLHYNMERMESSAHTHNDKLELDVGYMFRSSRRLVYCLCCENICKLKMLFVFGLRSFHITTLWRQADCRGGYSGIYIYCEEIMGILRCWELTISHFRYVNFKASEHFDSLIIYYPSWAFIHQNPRNRIMRHYPPLRVSLINDVPQGKTCAHDSYQNFIQWLSLIFLLWNKNFLTKFLNSIISLDLKSAVN